MPVGGGVLVWEEVEEGCRRCDSASSRCRARSLAKRARSVGSVAAAAGVFLDVGAGAGVERVVDGGLGF